MDSDLQEFYRFYVVLGHTSTLEMGGPDGLSHGDEPSACLSWRRGEVMVRMLDPGESLSALSFMRRVRIFTAGIKPGGRSRSSGVGVFNKWSAAYAGGQCGHGCGHCGVLVPVRAGSLCAFSCQWGFSAVTVGSTSDQRVSAQPFSAVEFDPDQVADSDRGEVCEF